MQQKFMITWYDGREMLLSECTIETPGDAAVSTDQIVVGMQEFLDEIVKNGEEGAEASINSIVEVDPDKAYTVASDSDKDVQVAFLTR